MIQKLLKRLKRERTTGRDSRARNVSRKQKQRFRALRFVKHLSRFLDSHRFPDFRITDEIVAAESKRQSHGERHLTESEITLIEPLKDAQKWKEVTIDGLVEEMAEWWSNRWGWWYPMAAHLDGERGTNDWIMKKALLEIRRRCEQDFLGFLIARGGCDRYVAKVASESTPLAAHGPNRFASRLANPIAIANPIECKGALSFWGVPEFAQHELARRGLLGLSSRARGHLNRSGARQITGA